jgi:hypothetical protein
VQINAAPKAAAELRSSTKYTERFGTAAPNPVSVADALTTAKGWSDKLQNAKAWYLYVQAQERLAWKHAATTTDPLRQSFELGVSRDASIAEELPNLAVFFGAAKARAQKAATTRKKNAAEKAAAKEAATPLVVASGSKALN